MEGPIDRRGFVRRAVAAGLVAPAVVALGCEERDGAPAARAPLGDGDVDGGGSITRPILLPWSEEAVHLWAPVSERPIAYVSTASHRIFVEHEFRDRVYWLLGAHISVSSGLWRIPLPGDDRRIPITPGDSEREFEEQPMRAWDPTIRPAEGDVRIRRGAPTNVRVAFACAPLAGGGAWLSAGPWDLARCGGGSADACREDFMRVGQASRFADRECAEAAGTVGLLTWACRGV